MSVAIPVKLLILKSKFSVNLASSLYLFLGTLKLILGFTLKAPLSSLVFVGMSIISPALRHFQRSRRRSRHPNTHAAWQKALGKCQTFFDIGTSSSYKQEVLLFGLRDWILDAWESFKDQSEELDPSRASSETARLITTSSLPRDIIKDILHVSPKTSVSSFA